jgi:MCP family monocarboxylic acid transporter-like MFS transporter 10
MFLFFLWTFADSLNEGIAFVVFFGMFSGAVIGLPPASVADILDKNNKKQQAKLGQWTGQVYTVAAPFALTGPVIAGYLIQRYDNFLTVQMWSGSCLLVSSFCMAMSAWYIHGEKDARAAYLENKLSMMQSDTSSSTVSANTSCLPSRKCSTVGEKTSRGSISHNISQ